MILNGYNDFTSEIELVSYDEEITNSELKKIYLEWLNNSKIVKSIYSDILMKEKDLSFIDDSFSRFTKQNAQGFFIKYVPERKYIGTIKLDKISVANNSGEIGLMIGEISLWGKNLGEKSFLILLKYAFEILQLNRVWGGTAENNIAMQKLFLKTGFKQEGRLREVILSNNIYLDNIRYSILNKEWKSNEENRNNL